MENIYRLVHMSGILKNTEYLLGKHILLLGREADNDLVINDPEVSRKHARFTLDGDSFWVEDLGSTNGTFINGKRLTLSTVLKQGDTLSLGENILLRYEVLSFDPDATFNIQSMKTHDPEPSQEAVEKLVQETPPIVPPHFKKIPVLTVELDPPSLVENVPAFASSKRKKTITLYILIGIVAIILLFCVFPWIIVDLTKSYCTLFPGVINLLFSDGCL